MTHTKPRQVKILKYGWRFAHGDIEGAETTDYNDGSWDQVRVPHDWAIGGPFSEDNDAQYTAIGVDGETKKRTLVGRTGGLPHVGLVPSPLRSDRGRKRW